MAELATIARPYAEALFQASRADLAGTAQWLDALCAVGADAQLLEFAANPMVSDAQVQGLIVQILGVKLPPAGENFLRAVLENGRLAALPEVAAQFRALMNAQTGISEAIVYSAFPISTGDLGKVSAVLEKRFGRTLSVKVREDASLIGGIRVVVGDEVLDTSVKARLEQMKVALTA
jgi:F-type H+-transporting ATPase subunit delta